MFNSSKEIAELKGKLEIAEAAASESQDKVEALTGELTAANTKAKELEGKVTEAQGRITTLEGEKLKAEQDLTQFKADFDTKVNALVIERCAAAGLSNPIKNDPSAGADESMSRKDFAKLNPSAQSAFCLKGGKLTD